MAKNSLDELDRFLGQLAKACLIITAIIIVGAVCFANRYFEISRQENLIEIQNLEKFLQKHGSTVTVVRMQDESKREQNGKYMRTVERTWYICRFLDGYTVEIQQRHLGPTQQVPLPGEKWTLEIWKSELSCSLYFKEKVT